MKKKILSILLAVMMIVGAIPFTAIPTSAATPVSEVAFTMTGCEYMGDVANINVKIKTEGVIFTTVGNVTNYMLVRIDGGSQTTVTSGKIYNYEHDISIAFTFADGYVKDMTTSEMKEKVTLNGMKPSRIISNTAGVIAVVSLGDFDVTRANPTVTVPTDELTPADIKMTGGTSPSYSFSHFGTWYQVNGAGTTAISNSTKFEAGKTYRTTMYFNAGDGYELTDDPSKVSGSINGVEVPATLESGMLVLTYEYTLPEMADSIMVGGVRIISGYYLRSGSITT